MRVVWVQAEEGWTKRRKRDTTASSPTDHHLHSVEPDDDPPLWGLECLPADLCRALGHVCPRPSALPDALLRGPGSEDAGVWHPGADGLCRIPLPAVWPGHPSRGDELQIGAVLTLCQSPCRQLGEPGEPGPACGGDLSAYHPDSPGDVPHALLPERGGRVKRVHALWGAMPG